MIIVYTGPMFAGKSTALLEEYNNIKNKASIVCFKPSKDNRDKTQIRARGVEQKVDAIVITKFDEIPNYINENTKHIFIDEVQFINGNFNILSKLSVEKDIDIYVGGLKQTSELRPFGTMPYILAIADFVIELRAECECGKNAFYTYCKVDKKSEVLVGDKKEYIPVCRECYLKYTGGKVNG